MLFPAGDILIVDDDPPTLEMMERMFHKAKYRVRTASSGMQALKACQYRTPELILMDISMPGMDGFQTCAKLQATAKYSKIPVIFVSSLLDTQDKIKAFEVGGRDYVTKPFVGVEVMARVESQIHLARLQSDLEPGTSTWATRTRGCWRSIRSRPTSRPC